ncbi:MAG: hypothetical protein E7213_11640 [Clostridium sp.]|jgi:uncharacterized protein YgiM (DUF1202 family)|nr:hypothetical protein [Clostridium sp.]
MKKKILSLLLAGLTVVSVVATDFIAMPNTESNTVVYAAAEKKGTVTASTLNVRSKADTTGTILGTLSNGTSVTIVGTESNGWYKIKYKNGYGYVSNKYISVNNTGNISKVRKEIIARAEEMINFSWSSKKAFDVWQGSTINGSSTFKANTTYTGMPYSQTGNQMTSGTQFKQKIAAATGSLSTTCYSGKKCPLYGNDCSGFVSAAWGISRHTTSTLPDVSRQISYNDLQPGDILNKAGSHVVLFGGWADNAKTKMIILEQTPPKAKKSTKDKSYYTSRGYVARRWNNL